MTMADNHNFGEPLRSGIITERLPMRSFGQQISRPAFPPDGRWRTEYLWKDEKGELIWHISKVKSDWEAVHEILED